MPQYSAPGVYIQEVPGSKPIEGVGTATGAFVGIAERGPIAEPVLVTNWTQFTSTFGGYYAPGYLAYAVNQFFAEGGSKCYVVRVCHFEKGTDPTAEPSSITLLDRASDPQPTLKVQAVSPGSWGDRLAVIVSDASEDSSKTMFRLQVLQDGQIAEDFDELTPATAPTVINSVSTLVRVRDLGSSTAAPENRLKLSEIGLGGLFITAFARGVSVELKPDAGGGKKGGTLVIRQGGVEHDSLPYSDISDLPRKVNGRSQLISVRKSSASDPKATGPARDGVQPLECFALRGGWDGLAGTTLDENGGKTLGERDAKEPSPQSPKATLSVAAWREKITVDIAQSTSKSTFKVTVKLDGETVEEYDELTMDTVEQRINPVSAYVHVNDPAAGNGIPAEDKDIPVPLGLFDTDFIGNAEAKNGLHAFDTVDGINIVAIPDRAGDREVILDAAAYCQERGDCFFVADPPMGLSPQSMLDFKRGTGNDYRGNAFNSSYAALYYPWISVSDPLTGRTRPVPPSGAIAGTYSACDSQRGVHKAPAGTSSGYLQSSVGVERIVTRGEQGELNPEGINVIRSFPGAGVVVWGARTLSSDPEWRYVNVRRLVLFIEESIEEGTQWVVFESNDRSLWARVKRDVGAFLGVVWRDGALFGATAEEAFFVKIDDENNPPEVRDAGRLVIDVGVAPVKPAEFVVFRISQSPQGAQS